jgi:hypothetical protein
MAMQSSIRWSSQVPPVTQESQPVSLKKSFEFTVIANSCLYFRHA